ncbi:MAG: polysaccharide biosynthesis tyrosine autokinase [Flavobacteriales bacterium]|nr:polysaccharide biosynthesis tyrosine autokinase [Flavobacteriales bacterium]
MAASNMDSTKPDFIEEEIDLSAYWDVIRGRIWHILGLASIVTLLAVILVSAMPPIYKSTAVLLLEPEQAKTASMEDLFNVGKRDEAYFNTQKAVISSAPVLGKVIEALNLDQDTELLPFLEVKQGFFDFLKSDDQDEMSADQVHQILLNNFRENMTVQNVKKTNLIEISFESTSATKAADIVNALSTAYIQDSIDVRKDLTQQATAWMRERMASIKKQLSLSESKLQRFIEQEKLVSLDDSVDSLVSQELAEQTKQVMAAQIKLAELSLRYGAKHPKIIAVKNELRQAKHAMQRGKENVRELGRKSVKLKELQHEVKSTRELYETFLNRVKTTDESSTLKAAVARVIDSAIVPLEPVKPKKKMIVLLTFFATIMLGILLVFLLHALDSTIRTADQVEEKLGVVLLGLLPFIQFKSKNLSREDMLAEMTDGSHHMFTESIRTIRTGIMLSSIDNPHKVILVTSSVPGEGKSTVAANLAIVMGKMEKVLLIDADLRRPTVAKNFSDITKDNGLSELVSGSVSLEDCISTSSTFNIDIMHAGIIPPNPLELLASKKFKEILTTLESKYDRIIIDSAPVQIVSDSLVMSKYAKGVVFVVKADATSDKVIKHAIKKLKQVDAPLIGVILNQFDTHKAHRHNPYGYGSYYDQYGYTEEKN